MKSGDSGSSRQAAAVFLLSAVLLGFEIALLREMLVASWHHFASLVIAMAVLGFGASGTMLAGLRSRLGGHEERVGFWTVLACAVAMPACWTLATLLPVSVRRLAVEPWRQGALWMGTWILLLLPFLTGAAAIGLSLVTAGRRTGVLYAANLGGSGLGALATLSLLAFAPPQIVATAGGLLLLAAAALWRRAPTGRDLVALGGVALVTVGVCLFCPPRQRVDEFKFLAHATRLQAEGQVTALGRWHDPRGRVDLLASKTFHEVSFLAPRYAPPPLRAVVVDGHHAGSMLHDPGLATAGFLRGSLPTLPHRLLPVAPRVLVLGDAGGLDAWMGLLHGAREVVLVHSHPRVAALLSEQFAGVAAVRVVTEDSRAFVEGTEDRFDLVHLASLESLTAGNAGLAALGQDTLVTVEGIRSCLRLLSDDGLLAATRGLQSPPRDAARILSTLRQALAADGLEPAPRLAQVRDFLAACTIASRSPLDEARISRLRQACEDMSLTPVFFPGVTASELNHPDRFPGPEGETHDWHHEAARSLLGEEREAFLRDWAYELSPPTDDRPYFHDFFRWSSLGDIRAAHGALWVAQVELGFPFAVVALALTSLIAAIFTLIPGLWFTRRRSPSTWALVYFLGLGLGYLLVEVAWISRFTRLIGDPTITFAVCLTGFLVCSGAGSLVASRVRSVRALRLVIAGLIVLTLVEVAAHPRVLAAAAGLPLTARALVTLATIVPIGALMGLPFPWGLERAQTVPGLAVRAWAVNGFASAVAAPLATVLSMTHGLRATLLCGLAAYALAFLAARGLPDADRCPSPALQ